MSKELPQCKSEEKDKKLCHLYTPRQPEISERQVVGILGMTLLEVSASSCPPPHCAGSGNTAEGVTLSKPSLLTPQHLSLSGWTRQSLHAGCIILFLPPLWLGGVKENMRQDQQWRTGEDCNTSHMAESNGPKIARNGVCEMERKHLRQHRSQKNKA